MSEWISSGKALPEVGDVVLCHTPKFRHSVTLGVLVNANPPQWERPTTYGTSINVDHWMELPEPPNEH